LKKGKRSFWRSKRAQNPKCLGCFYPHRVFDGSTVPNQNILNIWKLQNRFLLLPYDILLYFKWKYWEEK